MLCCQKAVDWSKIRITLVHDGSEPFPEKCFDGMPFTVNQVSIPHGGIAKARNWCLDHSEAEWIKFCDFDDMFSGAYSLQQMIDSLEKGQGYDMLWFDLIFDDHGKTSIRNHRDPVFVHNKVFRRTFLVQKGIRFQEHLTWCEDSAFMAVIEMEINHQRIGKIVVAQPIYIYIVRDGSLCNRPEIKFANLCSFFDRHIYVAAEFKKRGRMREYSAMCARTMMDSYYTLMLAPGITEDTSGLERKVWDWYAENRDAVLDCGKEDFEKVLAAVNRERFDGGEITGEGFIGWLKSHERGEK